MPKLSEFYVDGDIVEDGQWHIVNYGEAGPAENTDDPTKLYFLIGSNLSTLYRREMRRAVSELGSSQGVNEAVELTVASRALLIGWRNYEDDSGATVPYSNEEAYKILSDPRNAVLREYVMLVATNRERVRTAHLARLRGKSKPD